MPPGDLFEKRDDVQDERLWLSAGSENQSAQLSNRLRMALLADVLVPGHGGRFEVTEAIRTKLRADVAKNDCVDM